MDIKKIWANKRSQSQVIVTVLLILIALAAVAIVSAFVIQLVRDNLSGTECFKTLGQVEIDIENGLTYFYVDNNSVYVSIERKQKDFNLTGILLSLGNEQKTKAYTIKQGDGTSDEVTMYGYGDIEIPGKGEKRTYQVETSPDFSTTPPNMVSIAPIIEKGRQCELADERTLPKKEAQS